MVNPQVMMNPNVGRVCWEYPLGLVFLGMLIDAGIFPVSGLDVKFFPSPIMSHELAEDKCFRWGNYTLHVAA